MKMSLFSSFANSIGSLNSRFLFHEFLFVLFLHFGNTFLNNFAIAIRTIFQRLICLMAISSARSFAANRYVFLFHRIQRGQFILINRIRLLKRLATTSRPKKSQRQNPAKHRTALCF